MTMESHSAQATSSALAPASQHLPGTPARGRDFWDEQTVALLRNLWREGLSSREIGNALGCTRMAVLGKVHRLGIANRGKMIKPKDKKEKLSRAERAKLQYIGGIPARVKAALERTAIKPCGVNTDQHFGPWLHITKLDSTTCRWPCGDTHQPDFGYCGAPVDGERVYCRRHAQLAYIPLSARRAKKRVASRFVLSAGWKKSA